MSASSSPIKDSFVYMRKKTRRDTVAFLSGRNGAEVVDKKFSEYNLSSFDFHLAPNGASFDDVQEAVADHSSGCQGNEKPPFSGRDHFDLHTTFKSQLFGRRDLHSVPTRVKNEHSYISDISHSAEGCTNELCSSSTEICNVTNGVFGTLEHSASNLKLAGEYCGDCSNSCVIPSISLEMFESPEKMCINILRRHGLLGESKRNNAYASPGNLCSVGPVISACKICGLLENALKMLICDDCEEAFHLSCYKLKMKKLPRDDWYCQSCFTKKRKPLLRKNMGTPSSITDDTSKSGGLISSMLRGTGSYKSRARVGGDFQVEVPAWSDQISCDDDYFEEPIEMDQFDSLECWRWSRLSKSNSIGNWLQCKDEDDKGNICGKWRRAPLFSAQTNDWDCSCALLWDPMHADCSVHQELDTEEVLKHLKYIEMFRSCMDHRMKSI